MSTWLVVKDFKFSLKKNYFFMKMNVNNDNEAILKDLPGCSNLSLNVPCSVVLRWKYT